MQIKLVEQLQKLFEEDLFPEASEEELKNRAEEQAIKFLKRLHGLKIGDKIKVKGSDFTYSRGLRGVEGIIIEIEPSFEDKPVEVAFKFSAELTPNVPIKNRVTNSAWLAPEDLELVESNIFEDAGFKKRLGQCYSLSGRYVMDHSGTTLVHGTIQRGDSPHNPHAWVEYNDVQGQYTIPMIHDPVLGQDLPKDAYMRWMNATERKRYTRDEMLKVCVRAKNWGPWESKVNEEDLFPSVSDEEKERREAEGRMSSMHVSELIDILADRCYTYFNSVQLSPDNSDFREYIIDGLTTYKGMSRNQAKEALKQYYYPANEPVEPEFFESRKVNEEELFPQASREEIRQREVEQEKMYPSMSILDLLDTLYSKAYSEFEERDNFDRVAKSEWITRQLMKYKNLDRQEAIKIKHRYLHNEPIGGDTLFNQVYRALNGQ